MALDALNVSIVAKIVLVLIHTNGLWVGMSSDLHSYAFVNQLFATNITFHLVRGSTTQNKTHPDTTKFEQQRRRIECECSNYPRNIKIGHQRNILDWTLT